MTAMKPASRILLVRGDKWAFDQAPYAIQLLSEDWRQRGIPVDETDVLRESVGEDVLLFPHSDLTKVPPAMAELLACCPRVVNRAVLDISKRTVSRQLVRSAHDYDGEVIVKSNLNYGAQPEFRAAERREGGDSPRLVNFAKLPWTKSGLFLSGDYPTYASPALVPKQVWDNPWLVVEKFLPERRGEFYCLRQYTFCGTSEINTLGYSRKPVIKSSNVVRREILDSVHPSVRAYREQLGFDYGKFDYVIRDGEAIVFDVNRTFSYGRQANNAPKAALVAKLADGIHALLGA